MAELYDIELLHCDWCGKLMTYDETDTSEFIYSGDDTTVHLCYIDREFVTVDNLATNGQLAIDRAVRDAAFAAYIASAINPENSERFNYPWY
jgi:hypothetical protein